MEDGPGRHHSEIAPAGGLRDTAHNHSPLRQRRAAADTGTEAGASCREQGHSARGATRGGET